MKKIFIIFICLVFACCGGCKKNKDSSENIEYIYDKVKETNEEYTVFTKDGIATLSELLPGRYSIQEVTSESGYQIEEQAFFFEITDVDLEEANFIYSFDIYNKKVNVPNTGVDAFSSTIFGILLVAIGNIVLCKRKLGF